MIAALIIISALVAVGVVLRLTHRPDNNDTGNTQPIAKSDNDGCCGMHITCERDSLLVAVSPEIVYYDDEELDRFAGRGASDYSDDEIEEFRDILLTLLPHDIAGWGRSIQLRGIELPTAVRDELLLIVAEARKQQTPESQISI